MSLQHYTESQLDLLAGTGVLLPDACRKEIARREAAGERKLPGMKTVTCPECNAAFELTHDGHHQGTLAITLRASEHEVQGVAVVCPQCGRREEIL